MEMSRLSKIAGIILAVLVVLSAVWYLKYYRIEPVPKPPLWGLSDPPVLENLTWVAEGNVEIANTTMSLASRVYGDSLKQLKLLGYSINSGNWSSTTCQWSLWTRGERAYYLAYNGTRFLSIRGGPNDVINATERQWLCGRPLDSSPINAPTPETILLRQAMYVANRLMENNISVGAGTWAGPMPDWYLSKINFRVNVGDGVDVLMLLYSSEDQVKYAEYIMKKEDRGLHFLSGDAEDYRVLIALKGRKADVKAVETALQGPPVR
ncbi:hypothetical protein [Thermococcus kodakarensis]|nr:hypothetical protein [Thermococcus kodakarensis]WCN27412.1 hypothetical protein POG15_07330 [Thermococcus kodakarensis]WCN29702.1 hypothetical protein POG21_07325 [Thermococcus kodakarensis]